MLRSVTMGIKNFLSRVKNQLLSLRSQCCMSLNCQDTTVHIVNLQPPSSCMTLNCPSHRLVLLEHSSHAYEPRDCLTIQTDDTSSLQTCPDLDPSSSTDSTQTHDSFTTPESPQYSPSPCDSLEEGIMQVTTDATHVAEHTQVRTDLLAYDSLVTTLLWLSLEPDLDPYWIIIMTCTPSTCF